MGTIEIPSFDFTAFHYGKILEALIQFKRINVPEFTSESPQDPLIQMLRAFALVGHLNNVNIDVVANESTLPTARLPEVIRNMLRLIDYELASASPAQVDMIFKLSEPLTVSTTVVGANSQVGTRRTATEEPIIFEILSAITSAASSDGNISAVFAYDPYDPTGPTFTDLTATVNDGDPITPWAIPAAGMMIYIGHTGVMWNKITVEMGTAGAGLTGVWERYDGSFLDAKPVTKARAGVNLTFNVNSLLGTSNRAGSVVRVQLDSSGVYENCVSVWTGGENRIVTSSLMGLSVTESDATTVNSYTIGSLWKEVALSSDEVVNWTGDGAIDVTLPEDTIKQWNKTGVNGATCYWLRYRIIAVSTPTAPVIDLIRIDEGQQFVKGVATQGQRQVDANLGVADGVTTDQEYQTSREGFIDESEIITVGGVAWTRVDNFLQSRSTDRHYRIILGVSDRATIQFGNGINGAIPAGVVAATYRYGVTTDGNVGALSIVVDKSGLVNIAEIYNPRPAVGWREAQSASTSSLELAKQQGPASLRNLLEVALGPEDVEAMTIAYIDPDTNVKPFVRSKAIEEGYGPKTVKNVVVASGGGAAPLEMLDALTKYFNGDPSVSPPTRKRIVCNQEVGCENYSSKIVNITATVRGSSSTAAIEDALEALIKPETRMTDGVTFEWQFGAPVYLSRIYHEIHRADSSVYQVVSLLINGATADLALAPNELPVAGTISVTEAA